MTGKHRQTICSENGLSRCAVSVTGRGCLASNQYSFRLVGTRLRSRRQAFSMAELMIAVVILGIGLLVTSSMFPIAWYKARDVVEATKVTNSSDAAEVSLKFLSGVSSVGNVAKSSFFPGDWVTFASVGDFSTSSLSDTRVHHLNLGNYLADEYKDTEKFWINNSWESDYPVADNTWSLDGWLDEELPTVVADPDISRKLIMKLFYPVVSANSRMIPPIEARPQPSDPDDSDYDAVASSLWEDSFEASRFCWSVFYRFNSLVGSNVDPNASAEVRKAQVSEALSKPRTLTVYHVLLKRPANARFARQLGFSGGNTNWEDKEKLATPLARGKEYDVCLPVPWRIEAELLHVPEMNDPFVGMPSEITTKDEVLYDILQPDTTLIDERTGQVFQIKQRREKEYPEIILTLDKEYGWRDIYDAASDPFPANRTDLRDDSWNVMRDWENLGCSELPFSDPEFDDKCGDNSGRMTDEPERRIYWVFPPPVDGQTSDDGIPYFDGKSPLVTVNIRQMTIKP